MTDNLLVRVLTKVIRFSMAHCTCCLFAKQATSKYELSFVGDHPMLADVFFWVVANCAYHGGPSEGVTQ